MTYGGGVVVIRAAERDDADGLARLYRRACEPHSSLNLRVVAPAGGERWCSMVQSMIGAEGHVVVVAVDEGSVSLIGFAAATELQNDPFEVSRYGYVRCMGWERNGQELGIPLYEALRHRLASRGLRAAQTDVAPRDLASRRFWEARGFSSFLDHLWLPSGSEVRGGLPAPNDVREVRASDSEAVLGLWEEMMGVHSALDRRLCVASSWRPRVADMLASWRQDPRSHVVVADGPSGVVGFAVGIIGESGLRRELPGYGHVAHLCVRADQRGRGVGSQLFGWLRAWFERREVPSIHLYASAVNEVAQRFWRGLGFRDYQSRLWSTLDLKGGL